MQQFSTPPQIAYLLAKVLNPTAGELILEPSARTGSLAAWLRAAGCKIHVNELSAIPRMFLILQGYQPTGLNAEFLGAKVTSRLSIGVSRQTLGPTNSENSITTDRDAESDRD